MAATATPPLLREHRFAVMGTHAHIAVRGGDPDLLLRAEEETRAYERRWSRFLDTSEISLLNHRAGSHVVVSPQTFDLVTKAIAAWHLTGGRFDPTVGGSLVAYGYDRTFREVVASVAPAPTPDLAPPPGPGGIVLEPGLHAITLPAGVTLDAGGIGKGLAADRTAEMLMANGADGALVNLGGDVRVIGRPPSAEGWPIGVPDPRRPDRELLRLAITEGAVATSSRLHRRWSTAAGEAHHLIDPRTGHPVDSDVVAVTVVAGEAWWAEALTKFLFLTGPAGLEEMPDIHAVVVTADGTRRASPDLEGTLR